LKIAVDIVTQDGILVDRHFTVVPEQDSGILAIAPSNRKLDNACLDAG